MSYNDFINYISEITGEDKTYADLENIINHGISWCENGEDENGETTTLCANCKYYKECDAITGEFKAV